MKKYIIIIAMFTLMLTSCKSKCADSSVTDNATETTSVQVGDVPFTNNQSKTGITIGINKVYSDIDTLKETSAVIRKPNDTQSPSETVVPEQPLTTQKRAAFSSKTYINTSVLTDITTKPTTTTIKQTTTRKTTSVQSNTMSSKTSATTISTSNNQTAISKPEKTTTASNQNATSASNDVIELPIMPIE